jgi:hypothetical protein
MSAAILRVEIGEAMGAFGMRPKPVFRTGYHLPYRLCPIYVSFTHKFSCAMLSPHLKAASRMRVVLTNKIAIKS